MSHTLAPSALHRLWLGLISYSVVFALLQTRLLKPLGLPEGGLLLLCALAATGVALAVAGNPGRMFRPADARPSPWKVIFLMGVALTGNLAVMVATPLLEQLWKAFGLTALAQAGGDDTVTPLLAVYICLAGPVLEELLYRGVVMERLRPAGARTAILLSALCFGLMHHDLYQGLSAFWCGLVYGWAAWRYGMGASIVLHIIGNSVAVVLPLLRQAGTAGALLTLALVAAPVLIALVGGIRLALRRRRQDPTPVTARPAAGAWRSPVLWAALAFDTIYLVAASFSRV